MAVKISTGLRNALLDTGSLKSELDGGFIHIYEGTAPASADDQVDTSGAITLLATIYSDGGAASAGLNFDTTATAGVLVKDPAETWDNSVETNVATGTAQFYVHVGSTESDGNAITASTTLPRVLGTVAQAGADLNLSSTSLTATEVQAINAYAVAIPEQC